VSYYTSKYTEIISKIKNLFNTKPKNATKIISDQKPVKKIELSTQKAFVNKDQKRITDSITNLFFLEVEKSQHSNRTNS
jgi:hypothetical protein